MIMGWWWVSNWGNHRSMIVDFLAKIKYWHVSLKVINNIEGYLFNMTKDRLLFQLPEIDLNFGLRVND